VRLFTVLFGIGIGIAMIIAGTAYAAMLVPRWALPICVLVDNHRNMLISTRSDPRGGEPVHFRAYQDSYSRACSGRPSESAHNSFPSGHTSYSAVLTGHP